MKKSKSVRSLSQQVELFNDSHSWQVAHNDIFSIDYMTDEELQHAVLSDILTAQFSSIQDFKWYDLFRFIQSNSKSAAALMVHTHRIDRVLNAIVSDAVMNLVELRDHQIRIKNQPVFLQAAMDAAGFWPEGFDPPPGVNVIRLIDFDKELLVQIGTDTMADICSKQESTLSPNKCALH